MPPLWNDNFWKCTMFWKYVLKYDLFSRYSRLCIFNHLMIYQISDVMMSISIWCRVHFWIYTLKHNSLTHQTWSVNRYKQGEYFSQIFWTIWRTGAKFQTLFSLVTCSNYSITYFNKFPVFHFSERVNKGELKVVNVNC